MKKILGCISVFVIFWGISGCNRNTTISNPIAIASDESGTFLINAQKQKLYLKYDEIIGEFSDIIIVRQNDKYGYINKEGKLLIKPQYQMAYPFSENKAVVISKNRYHIIDDKNNILYTFKTGVTSYSYFSEGMLVIEKDGKLGYLNDQFEMVTDFVFDTAAPFSESQAAVGKFILEQLRFSYINKEGEFQIPGNHNEVYIYYYASHFNNGYAKVSFDDEHFAFVDDEHNLVLSTIEFSFFDIAEGGISHKSEKIDYAQDIIDSIFFVVAYNTDYGRDYFVIDNSKTIVYHHYYMKQRLGILENHFVNINLNNGSYGIFHFTDNPLYVNGPVGSVPEDERYPFYFKEVKILSDDKFSQTPMGIDNFKNGVASFYTFGGKYGLVNTKGTVLLEAEYTNIRY